MRDTAQQVAKDVEKVKKIQSDILSAPTVDPKMKSELEDTMAGIKKKANTIRTGLKKMEVVVEEEEKANPNNTQMRMKKTQHMAISKTFIEVMTNYNQVQQDFMQATTFCNLFLIGILQILLKNFPAICFCQQERNSKSYSCQ